MQDGSKSSNVLATARAVLTNPDFADRHPGHRQNAWLALADQRGIKVRTDRLARMLRHSDIVLGLASASI